MAYTFGGNTGDDINLGMSAQAGGSGGTSLHMGWFYPTTLTAGRYLFSIGNTVGLGIAATTTELTWTTQNATTNGVWTSTNAMLAVNRWHFIAVLATQNNTGPAMQALCLIYDDVNGWHDAFLAQTTAPVGNFTGGTAMTLGNRGTGTVAFQGDIDSFMAIHSGGITGNGFLPLATAGAVTVSEWVRIYTSIIMPTAHGRPLDIQKLAPTGWGQTLEVASFHLHDNAYTRRLNTTSVNNAVPTVSTVNTAVLSAARAPNVFPMNWETGPELIRR